MLPSVTVKEIDNSVVSIAYTGETGAYVGFFEKGEVGVPVFISSPAMFKTIFGRGYGIFANDWYQVYNYLQYSSGIWVVRCAGIDSTNSTYYKDGGRLPIISNTDDFYKYWDDVPTYNGINFVANSSGENGDIIKVQVVNKSDYDDNIDVFGNKCRVLFSYFQTGYVGFVVLRNEEIREVEYKKLSVVNANTSNVNTLPFKSQYVYPKFDNFTEEGNGIYTLSGGVTDIPLDTDYQNCHDLFINKETLVIDNFIANQNYPNMSIRLAEDRRDMMVYVGLPIGLFELLYFDEGEAIGDYAVWNTESDEVLVLSDAPSRMKYDLVAAMDFLDTLVPSEFLVVINDIKVQYDYFSGKEILLNVAGDIAGLKSKASLESLYIPSAGLTRGKILNYTRSHVSWKKTELELMYERGCNFVDRGYMSSQRTFSDITSSFSRVNVRSLFNHIEREIESIQLRNVFDFIDNTTITKIKSTCITILEEAKAQRGLSEYEVVVSTLNTNGAIADPNQINIEIKIRPSFVTEYVTLRVFNNGITDIS